MAVSLKTLTDIDYLNYVLRKFQCHQSFSILMIILFFCTFDRCPVVDPIPLGCKLQVDSHDKCCQTVLCQPDQLPTPAPLTYPTPLPIPGKIPGTITGQNTHTNSSK